MSENSPMPFAICQELFEDWDWDSQCRTIAEIGYNGIEVAPFTLAHHPREVSSEQRKRLKETAAQHGLEIIGLHWLLAKTEGMHLTSPDSAVRQKTADYFKDLADLCADLGGTLMVLGSPLQRNIAEGISRQQALLYTYEILQNALPHLASRNVDLLLEPLTTKETNFINTCDEAAEIIAEVNHPNLALHQDVKAMLGEGEPIPDLIHRHAEITRHFHVNDANLLGPGMGDTDFIPIMKALVESGYRGWVSVEVFDYRPGAELIARESLKTLRETLPQ